MKTKCPHCKSEIVCEQDETGKWVGRVLGAGVGGWLGSSVGIAVLGTAISGMLPLALLGAYLLGNTLDSGDEVKCPKCNSSFKITG